VEQEHREVTLEVIMRDIGPEIDNAMQEAARIAASVKDDESREKAIDVSARVQEKVRSLEGWREEYYVPLYRQAEKIRDLFDPRIKQGKAIVKTIMAAVSDYNVKRERDARIAREKAEAEARRIQEEADRKRREAEEAERKAKEAKEAEARRKKEAEEAEARRVQAEKEAKERQEREAREAAQRERERKMKEEEDARIRHAEEARDVGNTQKVDTILDTPTPISPVMASPQVAPDRETLRIEQDLARKAADEKAENERKAQEDAEHKRKEAEDAAAKARAEADEAAAQAAAAAAAAAATSIVKRPDPRTTSVTRWKWDLDSDGTIKGDRDAFLKLAGEVVAGRVPIEYLGFEAAHPEKFRPSAINEDVQRLKDGFACPGLKAYPQQDEQLRKRKVGGR